MSSRSPRGGGFHRRRSPDPSMKFLFLRLASPIDTLCRPHYLDPAHHEHVRGWRAIRNAGARNMYSRLGLYHLARYHQEQAGKAAPDARRKPPTTSNGMSSCASARSSGSPEASAALSTVRSPEPSQPMEGIYRWAKQCCVKSLPCGVAPVSPSAATRMAAGSSATAKDWSAASLGRASAVHFAMFESDHQPGAVSCVPDGVLLSSSVLHPAKASRHRPRESRLRLVS